MYYKKFLRYARALGLPIKPYVIRSMIRGSNPRVYWDSTGDYFFNALVAGYLDKVHGYKLRQIDAVVFNSKELMAIAINYKILTEVSRLNILKYMPQMSYSTKLSMNVYLDKLKDCSSR